MPRYRYTAVDSQGKVLTGELEAAGVEEARETLAARGLDPRSIRVSEVVEAVRRGGWLSTEEAVELAGQLAELTKAGLPLAGGLRALAEELPGGRLPHVLREMSNQLEAGATLEAVIEGQGARFPAHVRGLLLAGLRSGHLAEVLEEFVDVQRSQMELRRRVWLSLAYPIVLLVLLSLLLILLQVFVVPQFVEVYRQFGDIELPLVTRVLLYAAGPGTWILASGTVVLIVVISLLVTMPTAAWVPRLLYWVPLIGPLWRFSRLTQLSRLMGVLLEQEVPLPDALRLSAAGLRDAYLAAGCRKAAEGVEAGRPLAECLASQPQFPPSMIPLIQWGERAPAMADAFRGASEMFEGRVQTQGVFLETVLLPITFLLIVMSVGFLLLALVLPMIELFQGLSS